jgi:hypothetical protein
MEAAEFDNCVLYGGISGVELDFADLDLTNDVSIRKIYVHLMTPHIMAFQRPEKPDGSQSLPTPDDWCCCRLNMFIGAAVFTVRLGTKPKRQGIESFYRRSLAVQSSKTKPPVSVSHL